MNGKPVAIVAIASGATHPCARYGACSATRTGAGGWRRPAVRRSPRCALQGIRWARGRATFVAMHFERSTTNGLSPHRKLRQRLFGSSQRMSWARRLPLKSNRLDYRAGKRSAFFTGCGCARHACLTEIKVLIWYWQDRRGVAWVPPANLNQDHSARRCGSRQVGIVPNKQVKPVGLTSVGQFPSRCRFTAATPIAGEMIATGDPQGDHPGVGNRNWRIAFL